jgi:hypothetical protein
MACFRFETSGTGQTAGILRVCVRKYTYVDTWSRVDGCAGIRFSEFAPTLFETLGLMGLKSRLGAMETRSPRVGGLSDEPLLVFAFRFILTSICDSPTLRQSDSRRICLHVLYATYLGRVLRSLCFPCRRRTIPWGIVCVIQGNRALVPARGGARPG